MLFNPLDYTTVFLSYDEPNCEDNYRHLLSLNPHILRVHGVKGSDTAHKEVAKLSKTDSVIIVDADNKVKSSFFATIVLPDTIDLNTSVLSFSAYNTINGLCYGNGGIKVWPVSVLESMRTHENSSDKTLDFDFKSYIELNTVASEIHFASSKQAFRSGYREGVKLSLEQGVSSLTDIDYRNFDRLWMWTHVGSDVELGPWAIYGARLGLLHSLMGFDTTKIIDFDYFEVVFNEIQQVTIPDNRFQDVLSIEDSKRIRENFVNCKRSDVVSYNTSPFIEWSDGYRQAALTNDMNKINILCSTGRDKLYGSQKIKGARLGKDYNGQTQNLYDYDWLKKEYDKFQ